MLQEQLMRSMHRTPLSALVDSRRGEPSRGGRQATPLIATQLGAMRQGALSRSEPGYLDLTVSVEDEWCERRVASPVK